MKILVLSESFIIRDSLNHLLNETLNTNDIITSSNANQADAKASYEAAKQANDQAQSD